jgi:hypothetical protein
MDCGADGHHGLTRGAIRKFSRCSRITDIAAGPEQSGGAFPSLSLDLSISRTGRSTA